MLPQLTAAYRLARWLTRHHEDAEEIVQEAYLAAFKRFDTYRGGDARAWMLAIVRNTFYSSLRGRHAVTETFDEEKFEANGCEPAVGWPSAETDPEAILAGREDSRLIQHAIEQLPLELREVLVLRTFDELSYLEIATVAGIPIGTVMSRLSRARKHLAARLKVLNEESK